MIRAACRAVSSVACSPSADLCGERFEQFDKRGILVLSEDPRFTVLRHSPEDPDDGLQVSHPDDQGVDILKALWTTLGFKRKADQIEAVGQISQRLLAQLLTGQGFGQPVQDRHDPKKKQFYLAIE